MKNINKNKCHSVLDTESSTLAVSQQQQQPAWKILKQVQDDGLICYNSNNGFTLIELLVVVLIIGILAAVALPQYQLAVLKSRYGAMKHIATALYDAEMVYFLAHGEFTGFISDLDVDLPTPKKHLSVSNDNSDNETYRYDNFFCTSFLHKKNNIQIECRTNEAKVGIHYIASLTTPEKFSRYCRTYTTDNNDLSNQLCRTETGKTVENSTATIGYTRYLY